MLPDDIEGGPSREGVLLLCGSRKPAPGVEGRSATRELLRHVGRGLRATQVTTEWADLRDLQLPLWDGRGAEAYGSDDLMGLGRRIRSAEVVVLGAPCYWGGVSGVLKNVFDLLGAQAWRDAQVPALIVGSDDAAAWQGAAGLRATLAAVGAWSPPYSMVVGDPREADDADALIKEALRFGAYVGRYVANSHRQPSTAGQG